MEISIIIPTYNSEAYVHKVLESIISQTFTDYEVLVLDKYSSDRTVEMVLRYAEKYPAVKLVSLNDRGIYDAMNRGIEMARGKWIYFMGADDRLANCDVLDQVKDFLSFDYDLVYGDIRWMPGGILESGEWSFRKFIHWNINHQRIFYRKSVLEKFGGYKLKYIYAADQELNIRLFCDDSVRKKHVPVIIAEYNSFGFSAKKTDIAFWEDWDEVILSHFRPHLSKKEIYGSLLSYFKFNIDQKEYVRAMKVGLKTMSNTFNPGILLLMIKYLWKSRKNAS